jgi:hypothetical protein
MASSYPAFRPLSPFRVGGDAHYSEFHEFDPDGMPDEADLLDMLGVVCVMAADEHSGEGSQP